MPGRQKMLHTTSPSPRCMPRLQSSRHGRYWHPQTLSIPAIQAAGAAKDTQLLAASKTAQEMKEEADGATLALNKAVAKLTASEEERARLTTRAEEAEAVSKNLTELHQQAQKYQSQLQDYNSKLQGDVATLNDTINSLRVRVVDAQARRSCGLMMHFVVPTWTAWYAHFVRSTGRKSNLVGANRWPQGQGDRPRGAAHCPDLLGGCCQGRGGPGCGAGSGAGNGHR